MLQFWLHLKTKHTLILVVIALLAAVLRLYRINDIPYGFYWDEAAITYNAWGLAVWNRDEFGNKLPVSFKSFGDYKAPLVIYVLGGLYKVTGLHPEYLRILVALSGVGSVIVIYFLSPKSYRSATAFFTAVSPWAVNFSRFGVEATVALFLFLLGWYFLEKSKQRVGCIYLAALVFVMCVYTYHSAKIVVPLFLLTWSLINKTHLFKQTIPTVFSLILGSTLLYPLIKDTLIGHGFERGKSLIFFNGNFSLLFKNIVSFFNPKFWILGQDSIGLRHSVPGHGVLFITIFILFLLGVVFSIIKKQHRHLIVWFSIGLLPSILSTNAPHAIRSLMTLPFVLLLAAFGYSVLPKVGKFTAISIILLELSLYLHAYYGNYAINSATAFQYGYKEAILAAEKIADGNDKIIVTDYYGQPYIYTLLYRKLTPEEFKFGALANYEFRRINWPEDKQNIVYVASPNEIPLTEPGIVQLINIPTTQSQTFIIVKK